MLMESDHNDSVIAATKRERILRGEDCPNRLRSEILAWDKANRGEETELYPWAGGGPLLVLLLLVLLLLVLPLLPPHD